MQTTFAALLAVIALLLGVLVYENSPGPAPQLDTPYQAVLLATGQLFYGRLENPGGDYPVMRDVYVIRNVANADAEQPSAMLFNRAGEWHQPGRMAINRQQIVLIEPVNPDSQFARMIEEHSQKKQ